MTRLSYVRWRAGARFLHTVRSDEAAAVKAAREQACETPPAATEGLEASPASTPHTKAHPQAHSEAHRVEEGDLEASAPAAAAAQVRQGSLTHPPANRASRSPPDKASNAAPDAPCNAEEAHQETDKAKAQADSGWSDQVVSVGTLLRKAAHSQPDRLNLP